jgi:YesN/AraC family two-component response regulator
MNKKTKILYVDDEFLNLELFSINFSEKYEVITATNGFDGLEKLNENKDVSVVISDMRMPGMNGIEFIRKAKQLFPDKKFYILTGFEITNEIQEALNSGLILKYFSKPFNVIDIDSTIQVAINNN